MFPDNFVLFTAIVAVVYISRDYFSGEKCTQKTSTPPEFQTRTPS